MKTIKYNLSVLTIAVLLGLNGCGGDSASNKDGDKGNNNGGATTEIEITACNAKKDIKNYQELKKDDRILSRTQRLGDMTEAKAPTVKIYHDEKGKKLICKVNGSPIILR